MTRPVGKLFFIALLAATASGPLAMQMFLPALPAIQKDFGVDAGVAQLVFSLSLLAMAVSTLAYGPLSDRLGRRPVLVGGMLLYLAGSVVCAAAPTIEILIGGRIVQAMGGASGIVLARSVVRDVYGHEGSARMISYLLMAMVTAPMLAPTLGGLLTDLTGWRGIFIVVSVLALGIVLLVNWQTPETHSAEARAAAGGSLLHGMALLMRTPVFLGYALTSAFSMAIFFAFLGAAPYLMVNSLDGSAGEYGLYFLPAPAAFVLGTFLSTRLVGRYALDRLILVGAVLTLLLTALSAVALFSLPLTPLLLFTPIVVVSVAQGLVIPNAQAGAINVDPRFAGAASGLTGFLQLGVSAVSNQLVGSLNVGTVGTMATVMLVMAAVSLGIFLLVLRHTAGLTGDADRATGQEARSATAGDAKGGPL